MHSEYEIILPPAEIFLDPESLKIGWNLKSERLYERGEVRLPEQGIVYIPDKNMAEYRGFPFSVAIDAVTIFKRLVMMWIRRFKNPFQLIFWWRAKQELSIMTRICLARYYLKPERYSRPVREIYRLLEFIGIHNTTNHTVCSVPEWDVAYRFRIMLILQEASEYELTVHPRREILRLLKLGESLEGVPDMKSKWSSARKVFGVLWYVPKFRRAIKEICVEINLQEFALDKHDMVYSFGKNLTRVEH